VPDAKKVEAEIAEATKIYDTVKAEEDAIKEERNKFQEGTPERAAAQEKREAIRPKVAAAEAAVAAAKAKLTAKQGDSPIPPALIEAVKKAQLDAKLATDKLGPAEKAVRETTQAIADAKKQIPELKARIPQLEKEGAKIKADSERAATALAKELEVAKARFEQIRTQYEAAKNAPGAKPATTAQNAPAKQS
jgi:chromosome segregation ATPase